MGDTNGRQGYPLTIYEEVVLRQILTTTNSCTTIIPKMKYPGLNTQPG